MNSTWFIRMNFIENNRCCRLRWENPENLRYYEAHLGMDLFGWCLTLIWGRKGTALGQVKHYPCLSFEDGYSKVAGIMKQRKRKGYSLKIERWNEAKA